VVTPRWGVSGRWLVLTAGMGAGHDQVAGQLAERIRARGGHVLVVDLLDILPVGLGWRLRSGYAGMLRGAPWLYQGVFWVFFCDHRHWRLGVYPLDALAVRGLRPIIERYRPSVVISTFHLAAQVVGRMRQRSQLAAPSVVVITEPAAHRLWLHPATDMFLCPYPWVATAAHERTGRAACAPGPVVAARFHQPGDRSLGRRSMQLHAGEEAVLISAGSWGVGKAAVTASLLTQLDGVRPIVLCGHNEQLRRRIAGLPGCRALGWREDLPDLFAASAVLVDQSGGSICAEAFAAGLPVVTHRPLPGHGRLGVRALAAAGLVSAASDGPTLLNAVDQLRRAGARREAQRARAAAVFAQDPAELLARWVATEGVHRFTNNDKRSDPDRLATWRGPYWDAQFGLRHSARRWRR
jgi:UDP-N-acetylglucosamine:LPS N-acetylglucosamine transferase